MATLTITPIKTFVSGETVTPTKLNELSQSTVALTAGTIVDADVSASAAIAASKLSTAAQQALLPAGAIMPFAMNSAPAGWLAANGTEYAKTGTYAALFEAISTTYGETNGSGGAGTSHFRVPDLRGYFVRGVGVAGQNGTNSDGTASGTFGTKQADELKAHTHGVTDPGHTHGTDPYATNQAGSQIGYTSPLTSRFGDDTGSSTTGISIQSTGGTETRPKNIAMLYCIKF